MQGGERAWSLGEAYAPEALRAEEQEREEERQEKRRKMGEESSDSEDVAEMLNRFSSVQVP